MWGVYSLLWDTVYVYIIIIYLYLTVLFKSLNLVNDKYLLMSAHFILINLILGTFASQVNFYWFKTGKQNKIIDKEHFLQWIEKVQ